MKAVRSLVIIALCAFVGVVVLGVVKKQRARESALVQGKPNAAQPSLSSKPPSKLQVQAKPVQVPVQKPSSPVTPQPATDRIEQLFSVDGKKLPIVETITYKSHVDWMPGKPAWVADYSTHYSTSRHFIARSLNRTRDYLSQKVKDGDRFNVFREGKNISFYLVVDVSQCKMLFYYFDAEKNERVFLKCYQVGLGRKNEGYPSGCLTPLGTYQLGERIAIYKPGTMGVFQQKETEMVRVFGTRWIPFEKEIGECSSPAAGYGLHGAPWIQKESDLVEDKTSIGHYESDGCIRLATDDVEELFSIIITKPTTISIVRSFSEAKLPGKEMTP